MRLTMCVRILSNNIAYHALFRVRREPGSNPACGRKKFFFLDIKKFLYTHEKDEFNDVKTHIFEKMY